MPFGTTLYPRSIRGEQARSACVSALDVIGSTRLTLRIVTTTCWILALAAGGIRAWATRYELDTDIISYLDMADAYLRGDWSMALNGQWNPFYAWLLALMQLLVKPDPYSEFPAVTGLSFVIYVTGLLCLHFFLRQLLHYTQKLTVQSGTALIPTWALFAFGYLLYIYTSLRLIGMHGFKGPDLCIANFVYLAFGLLLWIGTEPTRWLPYGLLGLVLGCGYLTKAIMLPIGFVFLAISLSFQVDLKKTLTRGMLAFLVFIVIAVPFIAVLSQSKGRFTYSDTGKYNYALFVCMGPPLLRPWSPPYFHWQGDIPGCGTPTHPTRKIYSMPAVYEFGAPFHATYGAWYDPSYWYEGVLARVDIGNQIRVLRFSLDKYVNLFVRGQPLLVIGFIILAALSWSWRSSPSSSAARWLWLAPIAAVLSLYGLVHVENRFMGAYITVFWLGLYMTGIRLPDSHSSRTLLGGVLGGIAAVILFSTLLPMTLGDIRAITVGQAEANDEYVRVAKGVRKLGIQPGTQIACIGNAFDSSLWARMARVRITAEITPKDAPDYWQADRATKKEVREILARTGVKAIVTDSPLTSRPSDDSDTQWQLIDLPSNQDKRSYYISFL